ncbi:MAG: twin-arginine translocase TatA/TatE family subunit [Planctomycetes bacterium]|nr:twin-arginine translocase TatA/TatE family subunit [Planctomycetota bacterium]
MLPYRGSTILSSVILAGILGSFEQDILFVVIALLLFGRRLPEVAGTLGRKVYQFRRGLDEMKSEISKPIRDSIEAPIREAAQSARSAVDEARADVNRTAAEARLDAPANAGVTVNSTNPASRPVGEPAPADDGAPKPRSNPFPYPRAPGSPAQP